MEPIKATRDEVVISLMKYDIPNWVDRSYYAESHRHVERTYELLTREGNRGYRYMPDIPVDVVRELIEIGKAISSGYISRCGVRVMSTMTQKSCIIALDNYYGVDTRCVRFLWDSNCRFGWDKDLVTYHQDLLRIRELLLPFEEETAVGLLVAVPEEVLREIAAMKETRRCVEFLDLYFESQRLGLGLALVERRKQELVKFLWEY